MIDDNNYVQIYVSGIRFNDVIVDDGITRRLTDFLNALVLNRVDNNKVKRRKTRKARK